MAGQVTPPFAYYGGKTTLALKIADVLPEHKHYVEPFAGSLAVLLAKDHARWETVNDLDGLLVNFWRVLRDSTEELIHAASLTPHSRDEYAMCCGQIPDDLDDIERARRVWVRITQGRGNSVSGKSGWRYGKSAMAKGTSWPQYLTAYVDRMYAAAERLSNVSIENRDAIDLIKEYGAHEDVCLYVDPPYVASSRVALNQYRLEAADADFHERLAVALNGCKASVVLSGYESPEYTDLFKAWRTVEMTAPHSLGATARTEVLWINRPDDCTLALDFGDIA